MNELEGNSELEDMLKGKCTSSKEICNEKIFFVENEWVRRKFGIKRDPWREMHELQRSLELEEIRTRK